MTWFARMPLIVSLVLLAGCHTLPVDPGSGWGRVDRTFAGDLRATIQATLMALDDVTVHPTALSFQSMTEGKSGQTAMEIAPPLPPTNADLLTDKLLSDDIFVRHQLTFPHTSPVPFRPVLLTYKGESLDGRSVVVIVRASRFDDSKDANTVVMARIGHAGDANWSRIFLDKVAARLAANAASAEPVRSAGLISTPVPPHSTSPR